VIVLLCLLLAAARPPFVEGRVGEPSGAAAPYAVVRLAQGEKTQVVRTGADGRFRFRAFEGPASLSVTLPQGWVAAGPLSRTVGPAVRGDVIRADFGAVAQRVLRGRLLVEGAPLPETEINAGSASARTDARGQFVLDGLPAGAVELQLAAPALAARVEMPAGPANVSRDVIVAVPDLASVHLTPVGQARTDRRIEDWVAGKPLTTNEVSQLERVAALAALDSAFRLAIVVTRADAAEGAQAAARLQRYLMGPALVPRERLVFAVGEFARPRHVTVLLTRLAETR
jgi:hypothetical protein